MAASHYSIFLYKFKNGYIARESKIDRWHRVRRLLPEFLQVPAMMIPVFIPVHIETLQQGDMIREELKQNLLYQEVNLRVDKVTQEGKAIVSMETKSGVDLKAFMELLKQ